MSGYEPSTSSSRGRTPRGRVEGECEWEEIEGRGGRWRNEVYICVWAEAPRERLAWVASLVPRNLSVRGEYSLTALSLPGFRPSDLSRPPARGSCHVCRVYMC